jgi:hypothetical protein
MKTKVYVYNDVCDANEIPMVKEVLYQRNAKDDEITDIAIFTDGSMGCFDRVINRWYSYKEPTAEYASIVNKIRQAYADFKNSNVGNVHIGTRFNTDFTFMSVNIYFTIGQYICNYSVTRCNPEDWKEIIKYLPTND